MAIALPAVSGENPDAWLPPAARRQAGRLPSGRGLTRDQAYASCLGEAAELVSACFWGDEALVRAPYCKLGARALHPKSLLLISEEQYDARDYWNATHGAYDWLPTRFDEDMQVDWIEASSPDGGERVLVPAAYAYIGHSDRGDHAAFAVADSNGCAAGSTWEEAAVAGFLELVERDATALWWYGLHSRPSLELRSIEGADALIAWLADRQRGCCVFDLTADLGIPVRAAVSTDCSGGDVSIGTAAHFDGNRAAIAALTEMLQIEFSLKMRRGMPVDGPDAFQFWLDTISSRTMPHLADTGAAKGSSSGVRNAGPATLENCARICRDAGLQLFLADLTRPAIAVPVARVIVPGMRPTRRRLADGRLFEVPVSLGWRRNRSAVADMNSFPLVI